MTFDEQDVEELVRANLALTKENNRLLKKMRRDAIIGRIFKLLLILILIGAPIFIYYYYLQSYVQQLNQTYIELQGDVEDLRELKDGLPSFPDWMQGLLGGAEAEITNEKPAPTASSSTTSRAAPEVR